MSSVHRSRLVWVLLFLLAATFFSWLMPGAAHAHSGEESYVYLDIFDDGLEGRVEFPVKDLNEVLGIDIPQDEAGAITATEANLEAIQAYAAEHLSLGLGGEEWPLEFEGFRVLPARTGTYSIVDFVVLEEFDTVPRTFDVTYDGIIESLPQKSALLLIATDFGSGTFANEGNHLLTFTSGGTTQQVALDDASFIAGVTATIGLGIDHIFIGSDHILFIAALVLPAVLIIGRSRKWLPAPSFRSSLWRVVKIATSFTVAHTVTLTLGGLGIVELPVSFVESTIALSIALAALHNLRPIAFNKEWIIAFAFGLFHGFGFAGLLADLGLHRSNRVVSLLGFNLGIEIGQVAIILLVFPALFILRRTRFYVPFMWLSSAGLIFIAMGWFIDRAVGTDTGIDLIVTRLFVPPRPLIFVALLTVIAIVAYRVEQRRGRLLDLPAPAEVDVTEDREPVPVA